MSEMCLFDFLLKAQEFKNEPMSWILDQKIQAFVSATGAVGESYLYIPKPSFWNSVGFWDDLPKTPFFLDGTTPGQISIFSYYIFSYVISHLPSPPIESTRLPSLSDGDEKRCLTIIIKLYQRNVFSNFNECSVSE